ncbi:MAG: hypothetical protein GOMPHAMPRED_007863 [Gomphillus americanus]|uniref:Uncharacterized protein n=1 Tax=Gomphillus americanus TaxID=1940652 RepID=A0A8H3EVE1_9LECA|nr:MAG: hypothetical protein GOMPHAMPRED_007863 [Gomphillus americanus]
MSSQIIDPKIMLALNQVRNSQPEDNLNDAQHTVNQAIEALWKRIRADKDKYAMNENEFALFNFSRDRFTTGEDKTIAQKAVGRFWDTPATNGARN